MEKERVRGKSTMTANVSVVTPHTVAAASPVQDAEDLLARRPPDLQIQHLCDTRALHRLVARSSTRRRPKGAAGRYRQPGEPVYVFVNVRPEAPMVSRTCPPERVAPEMQMLGRRIRALLADSPAPDARRSELAAILATFFRIHP